MAWIDECSETDNIFYGKNTRGQSNLHKLEMDIQTGPQAGQSITRENPAQEFLPPL